MASHPVKPSRHLENGLTPFDRLILPSYLRFHLTFRLTDPVESLSQFEAAIPLLLQGLPILNTTIGWTEDPQTVDRPQLGLHLADRLSWKASHVLKVRQFKGSLNQAFETGAKRTQERYMPVSYYPGVSQPAPAFRMQANLFQDGLLLTLAFHHSVFDSIGLAQVVAHLARCCREPKSPSTRHRMAVMQDQEMEARKFLALDVRATLSDPDVAMDSQLGLSQYVPIKDLDKYYKEGTQVCAHAATTTETRTFRVPGDRMARLKAQCTAALSSDTGNKSAWVSRNDLVVALMWVCLMRVRHPELASPTPQTSSAVTTTLCMPVNIRRKMIHPLPDCYMGNGAVVLQDRRTVQDFWPETPESPDSWESVIARIAGGVRQRLQSIKPADGTSLLHFLHAQPVPRLFAVDGTEFVVSTWRDLPFYEMDFGGTLAQPQNVSFADGPSDGFFLIMPRRGPDGPDNSWEVHVSLQPETMKRIAADKLWQRYLDAVDFKVVT